MSDTDKKKKDVESGIPQSAFEEALRAVENIEKQQKASKKKGTARKRNTGTAQAVDIESDADDLDSLLSLLETKGKVTKQSSLSKAKPKKPAPEQAAGVYELPEDTPSLSDIVDEDINLEKEADFFRKILFDDPEMSDQPGETAIPDQPKTPPSGATPSQVPGADPEEVKELNEKLMRLQAEFENYKKRVIKEAREAKKYYNDALMLSLLPIVDNFDRAINHMKNSSEQKSLIEGVELIFRQILGMLETEGLQLIDTQDEKFNPLYHEAVAMIYNPDVEPGTILTEYESGYLLNGRLLRPSRVLVSTLDKNQATFTPEQDKDEGKAEADKNSDDAQNSDEQGGPEPQINDNSVKNDGSGSESVDNGGVEE